MHRRTLVSAASTALLLWPILRQSALAADAQHYTRLDGRPRSAKPEVIEFFDYTCPACRAMEVFLGKWLAQKPAEITFKRVHVVGMLNHPGDVLMARAFYAAEALGATEKVHAALFDFYQVKRQIPRKIEDVLPVFASAGFDAKKSLSFMKSMPVEGALNAAKKQQAIVRVTPTLLINNQFVFKGPPGSNEEFERAMFQTLNTLPLSKGS